MLTVRQIFIFVQRIILFVKNTQRQIWKFDDNTVNLQTNKTISLKNHQVKPRKYYIFHIMNKLHRGTVPVCP